MVQQSVAWEVEEHARRQQRHGGRKEGGNGNDGRGKKAAAVAGWRDVRHACFRVPKAALAAQRAEEQGEEEQGEAVKDENGVVGASEEGAAAGAVVDEEAVAAEWEDEMVAAAEAAEAEGLLVDGSGGGVRDSDVERAQRMSRMLKSARAWNWLSETEELSIQMREGRLFCGFKVGGLVSDWVRGVCMDADN